MKVEIFESKRELGEAAARCAVEGLQAGLARDGQAGLIVATGMSQFEMLEVLVRADLDWSRVTAFHLDEYIGLAETHPASFRRYLNERFVSRVPDLKAFHSIQGDAPDPKAECRRLGELIEKIQIDVACVGIGENGHLAFNDPPADFKTTSPYLIVDLDEACRRQQVGEGWFDGLGSVPRQAISMSVRQILKSRRIVCTVPDERKAEAVQKSLEGPVTNEVPASILQTHADCRLFLDEPAASRLKGRTHER